MPPTGRAFGQRLAIWRTVAAFRVRLRAHVRAVGDVEHRWVVSFASGAPQAVRLSRRANWAARRTAVAILGGDLGPDAGVRSSTPVCCCVPLSDRCLRGVVIGRHLSPSVVIRRLRPAAPAAIVVLLAAVRRHRRIIRTRRYRPGVVRPAFALCRQKRTLQEHTARCSPCKGPSTQRNAPSPPRVVRPQQPGLAPPQRSSLKPYSMNSPKAGGCSR